MTEHNVSIAFSKAVAPFEPRGHMGVDINERNVTVSATNSFEHRFTELGDVVEIKERYREIRAKIGRISRQDNRIGKDLFVKYGKREKNRTDSRIHSVTKQMVDHALENHLGIKMEKLAGIRKKYRKGNGQGTAYGGRMNTWVFGETQRQTVYKAAWLGVPAYHVNPRGTSRNCPDCGSRVAPLAETRLYCLKCDKTWDRDDLASKNIMAGAVAQARPLKGDGEKERGDDGSNPSSRWEEVKPAGDFEPTNKQNLYQARGGERST